MSADTEQPEHTDGNRGLTGRHALWTLPNALSLLRIFMVPVLVVFLLTKVTWAGLAVFLAAAATDWLDGHLARKRRQITTLGTLLDPLADKLLMSAAFISLVELGVAQAWMVMVIIGRELAVTSLRGIAADQGIIIAASALGKYKLASQVVAVSILILSARFAELVPLGNAALWVVVFLSVWSATRYFMAFWSRIESA